MKKERVAPEVVEILERLYEFWERPEYRGPDDLFAVLIRTILSQNTTKSNTDRAFDNLLEKFNAEWEKVAKAPTDEVADAVEVGGLANQKAPRIQTIFRDVYDERGEYSLEFLRDWKVEKARDYLLEFKGVGPKTAAFTLMYAADFPVFPMDTHILRICERLGWIDESTSSDEAHEIMEPQIPDGEHYAAHVVMVRHGREICHARNPECTNCPILENCPSGNMKV